MNKFATILLCTIIATMPEPVASQRPAKDRVLRTVRGYLDGHWEYPSFLPAPRFGLKNMDLQLREEKWQQVYSKPVNYAYIHHPEETMCFRVIGQGYTAPRQPTSMQPWEGSQFIFVKITKLELAAALKCDSRMRTNDR